MAALFAAGDRAAKASSKLVNSTDRRAALTWSLRTAAPGGACGRRVGPAGRSRRGRGHAQPPSRRAVTAAPRSPECCSCLRTRPPAIRSLDEHWDGRGMPDGLRGEEIPLAARIACIAQTVEIFHAEGRRQRRSGDGRRRRGLRFDPSLVEPSCVLLRRPRLLGAAGGPRRLGRWEPADSRSTLTTRVSTGSPRRLRASSTPSPSRPAIPSAWLRSPRRSPSCSVSTRHDRRTMSRAALLHDIGKLGDLQSHSRQAGKADRGDSRVRPIRCTR